MCLLHSLQDIIANIKPRSPISLSAQAPSAEINGNEWEVQEREIISEGLAAAEGNYDEGICGVDSDVAGCIC